MNKLFLFLLALIIISCDDGDIIVNEFDFDETNISACSIIQSESTRNYVFYKNQTETQEALILSFAIDEDISQIAEDGGENEYGPISISSSNIFEYRKFNAAATADYFCSIVPPVSPDVTENFIGIAESLNIITAIDNEDDGDGIPAELEGIVFNDDGTVNEAASLDTDNDGIPDYKDPDDDGDNVLTEDEGVVITDGIIDIAASRNSDGEDELDYLDKDDDNDMVLTRQEATNDDIDPRNNTNIEGLPAYRDDTVAIAAAEAISENVPQSYIRTIGSQFIFTDLVLTDGGQEFVFDTYLFGTFLYSGVEIDIP